MAAETVMASRDVRATPDRIDSRSQCRDEALSDTDIANARRFVRAYGTDVRFSAERGWFVWTGQRWQPDDMDLVVTRLAKDVAVEIFDEVKNASNRDEMFRHARRSQSRTAIENMIHLARSEEGIPAKLADFDVDPYLLNVANGTIDLRTGELRPHRREDLISNLANVTFDRDAGCELWDGFLRRITGQDEELYGYLRRLVGYLLVGDPSEQVLHFLYGSGANGKSVFCEVVLRLLGDYGITASSDLVMLRRHGGIPNDVARLRGVRAAMMNETTQGARFDEAKLKDLTGGDTLTARFLHREYFDFRPSHRLVVRGNHKPTIAGTDEGIWRRLRLVPFTVEIPPDERDQHLLAKLEAELPGVLNWALAGCREWQRIGLAPPAIVTAAARQYREESDTLRRFIAETCEVRRLAQVKSSALHSRYREYCEQAGECWISSKDLPAEMERCGFQRKRTSAGIVFVGLELHELDAGWRHE